MSTELDDLELLRDAYIKAKLGWRAAEKASIDAFNAAKNAYQQYSCSQKKYAAALTELDDWENA